MKSILLVDDSKTVLLYISSALEKQGYEVIAVEDGQSALEVLTYRKDIQFVLSDLMMPGINGIELCRQLKSQVSERYIFFVLLSSRNDQSSIVKGIDAGADDFVDKKTSVEELQARIRAGFRTLELHNKLVERNKELDAAYQTIHQDLQSASHLMEQLLPAESTIQNVNFSYVYKPCSQIGGDMLGYFELDEQHVAFYVFDVSGHGVSSALMAFSIQQTLSQNLGPDSITLELRDGDYCISEPAAVIDRLNRRYQQTRNSQLYFTMVYAILNTESGQLRYCTAGHPKFLVWRASTETTELAGEDNFMIGALQPMEYVDNQIILSEGDVVWLYSDGLIEARRGEAIFSVQRLASSIKAVCTSQLEAEVQARCVFEQVQSWQNKDEFDDDASLLQVRWRG
ncbi:MULTISPECIES: PP2C family protein-serine/threonine phosphatase [Vibrio diabolicus subgroup]|uniref:PP2C family protein-serine/threonine phosphatase n=1 Tax=Vibrio diabolicus subgroup TaxID=2315253 RepID=UPI00106E79C5|nr:MULTISPECIES: SpoIIE family protein phosphatase [Vibrio diabolicus subgroup]MCS0047527.1 SpoIIE family protein phosphatase [Vibrio antiquarius]MCZ0739688.1 SpoIIE family protein phosphatase [Vibrio diabolicus]